MPGNSPDDTRYAVPLLYCADSASPLNCTPNERHRPRQITQESYMRLIIPVTAHSLGFFSLAPPAGREPERGAPFLDRKNFVIHPRS
jgi:hypothetical protein